MYIDNFRTLVGWSVALDNARTTAHKEPTGKEPSNGWKWKMLRAEHSPIRMVQYQWTWKELPSWVSVHLVRHHIGCEKFVSTQRTDRTGIDRNKLPQDTPVEMTMTANAQALINISRKRLCQKASPETRKAWQLVRQAIMRNDPVMAGAMVPECIYRGFCPELQSCGFCNLQIYKDELAAYRKEVGDVDL